MLTAEQQAQMASSAKHSVLCWLATVDEQGHPNVSPKEMFVVYDDKVVIADIASPQSVKNVTSHPQVCVSMVDVFRQTGVKLKGSMALVAKGHADFDRYLARLHDTVGGQDFPVRQLMVMCVETLELIQAPSQILFQTTETDLIAQAMQSYGCERFKSP